MRAVLQRALEARVDILNEETKEILDSRAVGHGLMVLLGVMDGDTEGHARLMAKKTCEMRIFEDDQGKLNRSLLDIGGEMLVVSNFTLGSDCKKGRRPSFDLAAPPEEAERLYRHFVEHAKGLGIQKVETGEFGAHMDVLCANDGPITLIIDTERIGK